MVKAGLPESSVLTAMRASVELLSSRPKSNYGDGTMPTLNRRAEDGVYYVRHFFNQHSTWQIQGEGVHILSHRRVEVGGHFSTDLFMELLAQRLVYHGSTLPSGQLRTCPDPEVKALFHERVADFHDFLHNNELDSAKSLLAPSVLEDEETASFLKDVERWGLERWKRTDTLLQDVDFEIVEQERVSFKGSKLGTAYITCSLEGEERKLKQLWLYGKSNWWLLAVGVEGYRR